MEELGLPLVLLAALVAVIYVIVQSANRSRTRSVQSAAIESEAASLYYRKALKMARLLDHIQHDDMIRVTIPETMREQIRVAVNDFYEEGDKGLPK